MTKAELLKLLDRTTHDDAEVVIETPEGSFDIAFGEYSHHQKLIMLVPQASRKSFSKKGS